MDVLAQRNDLRYILSLHEGVALAMAAGYAEASGKIGVTNFHVAPGLGNAIGLIYTAYMSRTPLLVTAGQQDRRLQLEEPLLWGDLVRLAQPYTKWAYEVPRPDDLPRAVRRAIKVAMTPPTGPVFLALPMDVLEETADVNLSPATRPDLRPGPLPELLAQAAEILCASKNPTLIVGDRVSKSGALAEVVALAETLGARVYAEPQANTTAFPSEHPLFAGVLPGLSQGIRRALAPALAADAVVVNESVTAGGTLRAWLKLKDEKSFFQAKGGGLGFGLPAVVGVKLALADRPVVGLIGEGSAMYAIQGLWTAAHYEVSVVFVICNNAQYRILKSGLLAFRSEPAKQGKFVGMDLIQPEIDFVTLAQSLGVAAERISKPQEVGPALRQALSRHGPSLIDVPIDRSVKALF